MKRNALLVDCGAIERIINDESKFTRFGEGFKPNKHSFIVQSMNIIFSVQAATERGACVNFQPGFILFKKTQLEKVYIRLDMLQKVLNK